MTGPARSGFWLRLLEPLVRGELAREAGAELQRIKRAVERS